MLEAMREIDEDAMNKERARGLLVRLVPSRLVLVFLLIVVAASWKLSAYHTSEFNKNVSELLDFYHGLNMGMTQTEVSALYRSKYWERLFYHPGLNDFYLVDATEISTKSSLLDFEKNWVLYLQFTDGKLVAMRFRISDNPWTIPSQPVPAPPDQSVQKHKSDNYFFWRK
jgi:hypothetical protein